MKRTILLILSLALIIAMGMTVAVQATPVGPPTKMDVAVVIPPEGLVVAQASPGATLITLTDQLRDGTTVADITRAECVAVARDGVRPDALQSIACLPKIGTVAQIDGQFGPVACDATQIAKFATLTYVYADSGSGTQTPQHATTYTMKQVARMDAPVVAVPTPTRGIVTATSKGSETTPTQFDTIKMATAQIPA